MRGLVERTRDATCPTRAEAPEARRPGVGGAYANYVLGVLVLVYVAQLPGSSDHHDPRRGHQSRPRRERRPDRLSLRHRLRRLLRDLRDSARAARRRLEPAHADRDRPRLLEPDDGALGPRARLRRARGGAHRRRRGRSQRLARGLLDARRFLSAAPPRDGARDLLERHLPRRRTRPDDRRTGRRPLERGVPAGHGSLRPEGLAGRVSSWSACPGLLLAVWVRTLREPVRGAADGLSRASEPHPFRAFLHELRRRAAALHALAPRARGRRRARHRAQPRRRRRARRGLRRAGARDRQSAAVDRAARRASTPPSRGCSTLGLRDRAGAALLFRTPTLQTRRSRPRPAGVHRLRARGLDAGLFSPRARAADRRGRDLRRPHGRRRGRARRDARRPARPIACAARGPRAASTSRSPARSSRFRSCGGCSRRANVDHRLPAQLPGLDARLDVDRRRRLDAAGSRAPAHARGGLGLLSARDHVRGLRARPVLHRRAVGRARRPGGGDALALLANVLAIAFLWRALHTLPRDEATLRARARAAGEPGL